MEQNLRFKRLAEEKLAKSYVIREFEGILPGVRLIGFSQAYEENEWNKLSEFIT